VRLQHTATHLCNTQQHTQKGLRIRECTLGDTLPSTVCVAGCCLGWCVEPTWYKCVDTCRGGKIWIKRNQSKPRWYYWKIQRTEDTVNVETGDFPRDPLAKVETGKNRILYFPSGRYSFESIDKIKELYNQRKVRIPRLQVPIFRKAIIDMNKSQCRMGLKLNNNRSTIIAVHKIWHPSY